MTLREVFSTFSKGPEMDGRTFVKLLKDNDLIDRRFTSTDADLIFAKTKRKGSHKINYEEFERALEDVAKRKGVDTSKVTHQIKESQGPEFHGTHTESVKFHDDKSLYTGVHRHGGPSTVDAGRTMITSLGEIADRSATSIRGLPERIADEAHGKPQRRTSAGSQTTQSSRRGSLESSSRRSSVASQK